MRRGTAWWWAGPAVVAGLGAIQFVPGGAVNPPVTEAAPAPPEVRAILRQACHDCHSHETRLPWYGRVASFSWLVARDVWAGRAKLNFSTWDQYGPFDAGATLSRADREAVRRWAASAP